MSLTAFALIAATCAPHVHNETINAIVAHESAGNPYAININGSYKLSQKPKTKEEAIAIAKELKSKGVNFDSGLAQINSANLDRLNIGVEEIFDPCVNLKAAESILGDCYSRAVRKLGKSKEAIEASLSCYNTGKFEAGLKNGYVRKVMSKAEIEIPALDGITFKKATDNYDDIKEIISQDVQVDNGEAFQKGGMPDAFNKNN